MPDANRQVNVAIIGLGFGAEFIPIYQAHPHANMYAICQRRARSLHVGAFACARYTDFEQVLATALTCASTAHPDHGWMSTPSTQATRLCTVP